MLLGQRGALNTYQIYFYRFHSQAVVHDTSVVDYEIDCLKLGYGLLPQI